MGKNGSKWVKMGKIGKVGFSVIETAYLGLTEFDLSVSCLLGASST